MSFKTKKPGFDDQIETPAPTQTLHCKFCLFQRGGATRIFEVCFRLCAGWLASLDTRIQSRKAQA